MQKIQYYAERVTFSHIAAIIILSTCIQPVYAGVDIAGSSMRADGDSFLHAISSTNPRLNFITRLSRYYDLDLTNAYVGGSNTSQVISRIYRQVPVPSPYETHLLNVGFVDLTKYYNLLGTPQGISNRISAMVAYLRLGSITSNNDPTVTYTGTGWVTESINHDNLYNPIHVSYTRGDMVTIPFTGPAVSASIIQFNRSYSSNVVIKVDGVERYYFTPDKPECLTIDNYCAKGFEITGLNDADHILTIQNAGNFAFGVDWFGTPRAEPPVIIVNGITKKYNTTTPQKYYDTVDITNLMIQTDIADFFDERVVFVDNSNFNSSEYPYVGPVDITHPNNLGHERLARNVIMTIGGGAP